MFVLFNTHITLYTFNYIYINIIYIYICNSSFDSSILMMLLGLFLFRCFPIHWNQRNASCPFLGRSQGVRAVQVKSWNPWARALTHWPRRRCRFAGYAGDAIRKMLGDLLYLDLDLLRFTSRGKQLFYELANPATHSYMSWTAQDQDEQPISAVTLSLVQTGCLTHPCLGSEDRVGNYRMRDILYAGAICVFDNFPLGLRFLGTDVSGSLSEPMTTWQHL
jgi:hypothetical protein